MTRPVWVAELASHFWELSGGPVQPPRDLRRRIPRALPLSVVLVPDLCVRRLNDWLADCGLRSPLPIPDRPHRGALAAWSDTGFILVAADDDPAEQRFTTAHELAHFLRDYWQPRELPGRILGPSAAAVLDGLRSPSSRERLHAALRGVPLGTHMHLMDRRGATPVNAIKEEADLLACELLAPAAEVLAGIPASATEADVEAMLSGKWGLPPALAHWYAAVLFPAAPPDRFLARLNKFFAGASNSAQPPGMS